MGTAVFSATILFSIAAGGCDPAIRYEVLSRVFDNVPPPGATPPPRRAKRVRRQLPEKVAKAEGTPVSTPTPGPQGPPIEAVTEWDKAVEMLPKDAADAPDWMTALSQGVIAPRSSLDPKEDTPPEPLPLDVELEPSGNPDMKVIFPHAAHTQWLQCPNCHPDIFQMQKGADRIAMGDIFAGQFCGKCHGKMAFDVATSCPRCHVQMGGGG
ncbi:MAG: c(7)-type cytochrome triheme domain-containing protein [Candidatus Binatia bacterium]